MNVSSRSQGPDPHEILDRSIEAVQAEPDEEGPSAEVFRRTLAAVRHAPGARPNPFSTYTRKAFNLMRTRKTAAAVFITGSGLAFWVLALNGVFSTASYGQIAERIRTAKTLSWTETFSPGGGRDDVRTKLLFKEPGRLRFEGPGSTVTVFDAAARETLLLLPEARIARRIRLDAGGQPPLELDVIDQFRKLAAGKAKPIAARRIGDTDAKGFDVSEGARTVRVWADPKTELPLEVEMNVTIGGREVPVRLTDLKFDQPLDDGLFDLTPPADFTRSAPETAPAAPADVETAVVDLLRLYSKKSEGRFPARLDDVGAFALLASAGSQDGSLDADSRQMMADAGTVFVGLSALEKGKDYDYTPGDARKGDLTRMIFWTRAKDGDGYRVVYGDLSVESTPERPLPPKK